MKNETTGFEKTNKTLGTGDVDYDYSEAYATRNKSKECDMPQVNTVSYNLQKTIITNIKEIDIARWLFISEGDEFYVDKIMETKGNPLRVMQTLLTDNRIDLIVYLCARLLEERRKDES